MTDTAWIDAALTSARPQAVGALLRYFRNLDTAEEAFQNACLRALKSWPQNGPPRDPAAWLIMVGRNVAIDEVRRNRKQEPLPDDQVISDLEPRRRSWPRLACLWPSLLRSAVSNVSQDPINSSISTRTPNKPCRNPDKRDADFAFGAMRPAKASLAMSGTLSRSE